MRFGENYATYQDLNWSFLTKIKYPFLFILSILSGLCVCEGLIISDLYSAVAHSVLDFDFPQVSTSDMLIWPTVCPAPLKEELWGRMK